MTEEPKKNHWYEMYELECSKTKTLQEEKTRLERRIASIRGSHRVDVAKLKARTEQVERLKNQNKELQEELEQAKKVKIVEHFESYGQCRDSRRIAGFESKLTDAEKIIREFMRISVASVEEYEPEFTELIVKAEAFLKEKENA